MEFLEQFSFYDQGLAILMGLALSAVCGLRAFLPLFLISVLGALGKLELAEAYAWIASPAALTTFGLAVIVELVADKIPMVDHALDSLSLILKPAAAALVTASMITDFDPLLALVLSLLTGGLIAEGLHLLKAKARVFSSMFTGSLANPVLSLLEDMAAVIMLLVAWLAPILLAIGVLWFFVLVLRKRKTLGGGKGELEEARG